MNGEFDLTREVAEKVLKRAMTPVREKLEEAVTQKFSDQEEMGISLGRLKELDRDLGVLGITLATRYSEQVEYQTTIGVLSAENVRLSTVVEALAGIAEKYKKESEGLADALIKERNVNGKLRVLTPVEVKSGFHS